MHSKPAPARRVPRELVARTPLTIGDPGWLQLGRPLRELRPRTPLVETERDAVDRFRRERVKQGFAEQVVLPWP